MPRIATLIVALSLSLSAASFARATADAMQQAPSSPGQLPRAGFFGVEITPVPDDARASTQLPPGTGVLVRTVINGGSAEAAGIEPNDIIMSVGNHIVSGVADFVQLARSLRGGDLRSVGIRRGPEALVLEISIRPKPYEHSPDANTIYDSVTVDGTRRRTIVTSPRAPGRHPALLYVNGIGCFSQESLDLSSNDAQLLYGLTRAGFVTMRVEKAGTGDSEGPSCTSTEADFQQELQSYTAGLRALKHYDFVAPDAVFIVGISIGGVEAPLIAGAEPVRGVVVINTVAKPFFEYLLDSRRRQMLLGHEAYDEVDRRMQVDERCNHQLLIDKRTPENILAQTPDCADHIAYPAPFTFLQQWADVNVAAAWKAVNAPVLVVYGKSDFVSSIADDPYLVEMINSFHRGRARLAAIPAMDHSLNKAASMAESFERKVPGTFEPAVLDAVRTWLRDSVRVQGG